MKIVVIGLSLSSSWGNGHATTYRGLVRGLADQGHEVLFLEREVPWYANHRDLPKPDFCALSYYESMTDLMAFVPDLVEADAVIVGSYVPEGVAVIDAVAALKPKRLCFYDIDTPVTLAGLERGEEEYLARRQMGLFDLYLSFSGGRTLARLEKDFGVCRAAPLYCAVDPARYRPTEDPVRWDLGYLGTYSPDRQPVLERLLIEPARQLPRLKFVVAGPQYPDDIDWPDNVERIAHLPPAEHPSFYSRQRFTLNVTRADMAAVGWSPSVRLFEAAACRVPILTDRWPGLDELLPEGDAAIMVDGTADVVAALTRLDATERRRLADNAATRILAHHTGSARAAELIALLDTVPVHRDEVCGALNRNNSPEQRHDASVQQ